MSFELVLLCSVEGASTESAAACLTGGEEL